MIHYESEMLWDLVDIGERHIAFVCNGDGEFVELHNQGKQKDCWQ